MARNQGLISIGFRVDLSKFSTQMQNATRQMQKAGRQMQRLGTGLSVGVTAPFVAFSALSLKSWDEQEKAIAQVEAGLKSVGDGVGYTSEQLQKMASDLQNNTLFGDEEILKDVTAQLLTFTNIANEQFARTQKAALDLATRLDGDLKSASIQLGKALNDPVANLSALSRSGIQFSEEQKKVIKSLVETNRLADAQTIILNELEKQYGGSAEAAANAGLGPFTQLKNIIGDLSEEMGAIIAEAILPLAEKLKGLATSFSNLSPATKKIIVVVAALAAALGPVLAGLGFLMTTVVPGLIALFGALSAPVLAVVAAVTAIGVVIYKNWEPIKKTLVDVANYFIDLYNESTVFRIAVQGITLAFKNMWAIAKFTLKALWTLVKGVASFMGNQFKFIGDIMKGAFTFDLDTLKQGFVNLGVNTSKTFSDVVGNLKTDFDGLTTDVGNNIKTALENVTKRTKIELLPENILTGKAEEKIKKVISGGSGGGKETRPKVEGVKVSYFSGVDEGFTKIPDKFKEATTLASTHLDSFQNKLSVFQENADIFSAAVGNSFIALADQMIASFETGNVVIDAFVGTILNALKNLAAAFIEQLVIEKIFGTGKKLVDSGKASSNAIVIATNAAAALGPAGVLALPGLIASQLAVVQGAFAGIAAFADGGIVYGPTNALIGEYAGASTNPEVIAPLNKLKDLIQPAGGVQYVPYIAETKVSGPDLKLVLKRQDKIDNRTN